LIGQFRKATTEGRNRGVTDTELLAFAQSIPRKWQLYIMLKLFTRGRRKGELLNLVRSDITKDGIKFTNNKRTTDEFIVSWSPQLLAIVTEIQQATPDALPTDPLFMNRNGEAYINADGQTSGFDSIWQRYMAKAVEQKLCIRFTEHDLRGKAVENESLEVAARLLRHTSTQVTSKHYRPKPERI
jgi:integrase